MKTGGFSRFARKPAPKDSASGSSEVGGNSAAFEKQYIPSNSNDVSEAWGSSSFGSGFGFDAGLDETSFGGGNTDVFPVPKPIFQKKIPGDPSLMKSPPGTKVVGGRSFGGVASTEITFPKTSVTSLSSSPSNLHSQPYSSNSHKTVVAPPVITPVPFTKGLEPGVETFTLASEGEIIAGPYKEPRGPFHSSADDAARLSRRVTLGGTPTSKGFDSPEMKTNVTNPGVSKEKGIVLASPSDKSSEITNAESQVGHGRQIGHTGASKSESSDSVLKNNENWSMEDIVVEPVCIEADLGSFEEMFQSIMSKNLQFEDGWKNFEDKILDLSTNLNMKHGDILEIEQSALNLKQEMGQKFELLLSQVAL